MRARPGRRASRSLRGRNAAPRSSPCGSPAGRRPRCRGRARAAACARSRVAAASRDCAPPRRPPAAPRRSRRGTARGRSVVSAASAVGGAPAARPPCHGRAPRSRAAGAGARKEWRPALRPVHPVRPGVGTGPRGLALNRETGAAAGAAALEHLATAPGRHSRAEAVFTLPRDSLGLPGSLRHVKLRPVSRRLVARSIARSIVRCGKLVAAEVSVRGVYGSVRRSGNRADCSVGPVSEIPACASEPCYRTAGQRTPRGRNGQPRRRGPRKALALNSLAARPGPLSGRYRRARASTARSTNVRGSASLAGLSGSKLAR